MRPSATDIVELWSRRGFLVAGLAGALPMGGCAGDVAFNYRVTVSVRRGDETIAELSVAQIEQQMNLAVDRVMTEGGIADRELAAVAQRLLEEMPEALFPGAGTTARRCASRTG